MRLKNDNDGSLAHGEAIPIFWSPPTYLLKFDYRTPEARVRLAIEARNLDLLRTDTSAHRVYDLLDGLNNRVLALELDDMTRIGKRAMRAVR